MGEVTQTVDYREDGSWSWVSHEKLLTVFWTEKTKEITNNEIYVLKTNSL